MKAPISQILILPALALTITARAATRQVWLKHPKVESVEFAARLRTEQAVMVDSTSYADLRAKEVLAQSPTKELRDAFTQAQASYLAYDMGKMQHDWLSVTEFGYRAQWNEPYRDMISTAYLRLAQITKTPAESDKFLQEALSFNINYQPDPTLFPPPLLEKFLDLRKGTVKKSIPTQQWREYDWILINGERYKIGENSVLELAPGAKRVTLLSSTYADIEAVLHTDQLEEWTPTPRPLLSGNCAEINSVSMPPELKANTVIKVLFPEGCVGEWHQPESKSATGTLWATGDLRNRAASDALGTVAPSIEQKGPNSDAPTIFENKKFWWGAAITAAAIVIYKNSQRSNGDGQGPSYHEGF